MIRIAERTIFILGDDGEVSPYCLDELRPLLIDVFRQCSLEHDFLVEDILFALDVVLNAADSPYEDGIKKQELHLLLEKVLKDNGFAEAAALLHSRVALPTESLTDHLQRLAEPFCRDEQQLGDLLRFVQGRLKAAEYDLSLLSERFLTELIREEWRLMKLRIEESVSPVSEKIQGAGLRNRIALEEAHPDWDWRCLSILGGGSLFLSLKINIDLARILSGHEFPPYSEMLLREELSGILNLARPVLGRIFQSASEGEELQFLSVHLRGLNELSEKLPGQTQQKSFKKQVKTLVQSFFMQEKYLNLPVKYYFV